MVAGDLTNLLSALERGDAGALSRAFELLYGELRALAHRQRRGWRNDATFGTTALVHEAYVKLVDAGGLAVESRGHFLGLAARAMRHLLCNHARDRSRLKRGGALRRTTQDVDGVADTLSTLDIETIVAIDEALTRLAKTDERLVRVVECRFFAGLSIPETAAALGTSEATVKRDWALARDHLYQTIVEGATA
jgi:RNA polymerase sigma factor (TIGR02999 family)